MINEFSVGGTGALARWVRHRAGRGGRRGDDGQLEISGFAESVDERAVVFRHRGQPSSSLYMPSVMESDEELLRRLRSGDERAFIGFVEAL